MKRIRLPGLESTRCFAALLIVLFHLVHMPKLELPDGLSFIGTHFGFGVPLFYIVSAFGLFLGYQGSLGDRQQLREYYLRRFFRIAPLFYFMALAYLPFLWFLYDGYTIPLSKVISSFLFVFNFIPQHVEGYVWASWSIGVEMVFYLFLPLLILLIRNTGSALVFFLLTLFLKVRWHQYFANLSAEAKTVALHNFENYFILAYLHYFAIGILAYFIWRKLWFNGFAKQFWGTVLLLGGLTSCVALIGYGVPRSGLLTQLFAETSINVGYRALLGIVLACLVIGLCLYPTKIMVNRWSTLLGKTSFSLYLWHPVVIGSLMHSGAYQNLYTQFSGLYLPYLFSVLLTLLFLIPLSILSYRVIEVPGMKMVNSCLRPAYRSEKAVP